LYRNHINVFSLKCARNTFVQEEYRDRRISQSNVALFATLIITDFLKIQPTGLIKTHYRKTRCTISEHFCELYYDRFICYIYLGFERLYTKSRYFIEITFSIRSVWKRNSLVFRDLSFGMELVFDTIYRSKCVVGDLI